MKLNRKRYTIDENFEECEKNYEAFLKEKIIKMIQDTENRKLLNFVYHYLKGRM